MRVASLEGDNEVVFYYSVYLTSGALFRGTMK
jgi:hypothetical protein